MNVMYVVAIGSIAALIYAACMFVRVKGQPEGSAGMIKISTAVRKGAGAYLRRQYLGVGIFFAVVFIILLCMAFGGFLSYFTPFAFLTGGFFSGLSGFIGRSFPQPEQGPQSGFLGRLCYGLYRGGAGTSRSDDLVFYPEYRVPFASGDGTDRPDYSQYADLRHGRLQYGAVCPCGRRHFH